MRTRVLVIKKIIMKLICRGMQRVANLHKLQDFTSLSPGASEPACRELCEPSKGLQTPLVVCYWGAAILFFSKQQLTFVYFKKRKEGTVERKCCSGGFFSLQRWFRHMNENETFCVEKQSQVGLLGMACGIFKNTGPFLLKMYIFF